HRLAGFDPVLGLDPLAVEPHLAGAQEFLEGAVAEIGEVPMEPAIQPQARLVARHGARLDPARLAHSATALRPSYGSAFWPRCGQKRLGGRRPEGDGLNTEREGFSISPPPCHPPYDGGGKEWRVMAGNLRDKLKSVHG